MTVRYFLGVAPPEPLLSQIERFRAKWNHPHHKVEPHITIKAPFVWPGSPAPMLEAARDACRQMTPFTLSLGAPGRFRGARVLFLSVDAGPELLSLHREVVRSLAPFDSERPQGHESGDYHPHLTLASGRFGLDDAGLEAMEREAAAVLADLSAFTVSSLRCYRWGQGEPRWTRLQDLTLG